MQARSNKHPVYGKSPAAVALEALNKLNKNIGEREPWVFAEGTHAEKNKLPGIRAEVLRDALALTTGDRNCSYGDPFINFMLTARLKELFWDAMEASGKSVQQCSPFGHSIDMVFTNLARIATSPSTHLERDRFLDGANYMAIAYEVGVRGEK